MEADPYAESGEYLDLLSQGAWQALRVPIGKALRHVVPAAGPIVDVGAGSGLGVVVAAEAVADADIVAVEPSPVLRAVLLARVAGAEDLRRRVTVQAADVASMRLPAGVGGVMAINMIGHLPPTRRAAFFADVRKRLAPGAPLIVNLQPPAEVTTVPQSEFVSVVVGDRSYTGSGAARPAGEDSVTWTMTYRVLTGQGAVEREVVVNYPWYVLSRQRLLDELAGAGFTTSVGEMDVVTAISPG
ncbi:class I SAM-dependent methyltransferase [Plantactinospora solaniradicis]|uniref:Class I SAM-dependent methyltransferase n=1 Tax=Plantactinospora solaniradicis TaxID=1723736 RepID=A0ABW1K9C5_9ACTN